jgi:Bacterial Ig domain/CARDB
MARTTRTISLACGVTVAATAVALAAAPKKPDLVVKAVSKPPATVNAGTKFKVTDKTKNVGNKKAGASSTGYYLSLDGTKSFADVRLAPRRAVGKLKKGKKSKGSVTVTVPKIQRGTYHLLACADDTAKVAEKNEQNNCRATAATTAVPNHAPVAKPQSVTTPEETAKAIKLAGSDPDGFDGLAFAVVTPPAHGTLTGDGANRTYQPFADYAGADGFTFSASDGRGGTAQATVSITVQQVNDRPVVSFSSAPQYWSTGQQPAPIAPVLALSDVDSPTLTGASVAITANFAGGDELVFANTLGITGVYNTGTGVLTLSGNASVSDYQTALRSVKFKSTSGSVAQRTVSVTASDGSAQSAVVSRPIVINAPVVTVNSAPFSYTAGEPAKVIDAGLLLTDADSTTLSGATVSISQGFHSGDSLAFVNQLGITGTYNPATGVLTLSGSATVTDYRTALRTVKFSTPFTPGPRTITFRVTDTGARSGPASSRGIDVIA